MKFKELIENTEQQAITAGPPYPPEQHGIVQAMQYALSALGYSVGETGFDGKYGPRTTRAVRAFKRDYNVPGPANQFGLRSLETIEAIAAGRIPRVQTPTSTGNQPTQRSGTGRRADSDPNFQAPGYPSEMTRGAIERIIVEEARLRGIDPQTAIAIFRHEGASAYQSTVPRSGRGSLGGREASFGPYQLYIGGGLGNVYQDRTGRDLTQDNTREGIINQIRFALDMAIEQSWQPWYGRGPAGVGRYEGLRGAQPAGNWR
jgi:peptidoglycan hydrolase-like protein with peptidoglycan-binding domain